jgi:hypothetical protein
LFTDIVGSTKHAVALGDRNWLDLLGQHYSILRQELERFRGRELNTLGDGFVATFDGPTRGVRCAAAIIERLRPLGIEVRGGLHTGEIEISRENVGGIAIHTAARVPPLPALAKSLSPVQSAISWLARVCVFMTAGFTCFAVCQRRCACFWLSFDRSTKGNRGRDQTEPFVMIWPCWSLPPLAHRVRRR